MDWGGVAETPEPTVADGSALIEVHLGNPVTIRTNLSHVPAPVQNELQIILDCARLALEAIMRRRISPGNSLTPICTSSLPGIVAFLSAA
jgi:hypothetical protein